MINDVTGRRDRPDLWSRLPEKFADVWIVHTTASSPDALELGV